jgi:hypothetical protein
LRQQVVIPERVEGFSGSRLPSLRKLKVFAAGKLQVFV